MITTNNDETTTAITTYPDDAQQQREFGLFAGLNDVAYQGSLVYFEIDDSNSLSRVSTSSSCGPSQSTTSSHPSTNTMLDYESSSEEERFVLNEQQVRDALHTSPNNSEFSKHIQNLYVLYGNRSLLAVAARDSSPDQLAQNLVGCLATHGIALQRRPLPYTTQMTARLPPPPDPTTDSIAVADPTSLVLVGEITDRQLALVAADKSEALKLVEAKTGLRLKKIKKNVYFAGLLFQFVLLNKLMADRVRESAHADKNKNNGNYLFLSCCRFVNDSIC